MSQNVADPFRLSPTLASAFLGCQASAAWSIEARRGLRKAPVPIEDPQGELVVRKGLEHEAVCLAALGDRFGSIVEIPSGRLEDRFAATVAAMESGAAVIYQAALVAGPWLGFSDFLVRIEDPCPRWPWSYEPWDAKLSRSAKPDQLMQIALYGDFLANAQGKRSGRGHLMLGTGDLARPFAVESFSLAEVRSYVRRAARHLESFASHLPSDLVPEPCGFCGKCGWLAECDERWEVTDHLSRVSDISKRQVRSLVAAGVPTMSKLAEFRGSAVHGIGTETLARLIQQARLQKKSTEEGAGIYEMLPRRPGFGFDRLPLPDEGDLFFDFEGDPMHPGGLEYLCGVLWASAPTEDDGEPVPGRPGLRFRAFWAHDRAEEKTAFAELMTFLKARLDQRPNAHLYHYAPYEKTALRRLASMHGVAEGAVDDLLRGHRMVDLYRVVRESIRVGEASYSIKSLERFYMPARTTEVVSGGDSLVIYDRYRQTRETSLLNALRDYNRDDCLSTLLLRDWLAGLATSLNERPDGEPDAEGVADEDESRRTVEREERERDQAALEALLIEGNDPDTPEGAARQLVSDLVGFHRREEKPSWWAYFDRQERDVEELRDDDECLAGCVADGEDWIGQDKRSLTFRLRFPEQATKLRAGDKPCLATDGSSAGSIVELDEAALTVTLKRTAAKGHLPSELSLMPGRPIENKVLREAVRAVAVDMAGAGSAFPHIAALLRRDPPRLAGMSPGAPIADAIDRDAPRRLLAAATAAVQGLDRSWLVIQGPPGTGKTYTTSHLIASLVRAGKTVGIASNSHKAIDNVLHAVEQRFIEAGDAPRPLGQKKDGSDVYEGRGFIEGVEKNEDVDPEAPIIGGTAWLFARPEFRATRDVLFVDEAGQVSLGNLVAMATSARSVVLVGDQMQLAQPIQGSHPGNSGISALDHLLEGRSVVPPDRGIFLAKTWRMHPDLCAFVSAAVYDSQLESETGCARQRLVLPSNAHPALKPAGLSFLPVAHEGCRQRSTEEASVVRDVLDGLLACEVVDRAGRQRKMSLDDVLVVAPYNVQVNLLRATLPAGARVGTVDRFQGQEAEAVIVSMATSGADDMPRDASFLLSRNRMNVALSRARCLAVMIASPGLLDLVAKDIEEMKLANLFCWAEDYSRTNEI